jgi:hypothetical protein
MDALSDMLTTIQASANTYVCRAVGEAWTMQVQYHPQGIFHVVVEGQCYLRQGGSEELFPEELRNA